MSFVRCVCDVSLIAKISIHVVQRFTLYGSCDSQKTAIPFRFRTTSWHEWMIGKWVACWFSIRKLNSKWTQFFSIFFKLLFLVRSYSHQLNWLSSIDAGSDVSPYMLNSSNNLLYKWPSALSIHTYAFIFCELNFCLVLLAKIFRFARRFMRFHFNVNVSLTHAAAACDREKISEKSTAKIVNFPDFVWFCFCWYTFVTNIRNQSAVRVFHQNPIAV